MKKGMNLRKIGAVTMATAMLLLTACSNDNANTAIKEENSTEAINVISREEGSGTRSAFIEITGILEKNDSGEEIDNTSEEAIIQNSTEAVLTAVSNDVNAIGYVSLGSLNDTVKALKIDGIEATAENVKNESYKIQRPFNIVYKDSISSEAQDFLKYIGSGEAQKIIEEMGYIYEGTGEAYTAIDNSAKITIAGSTSITPLMEKLAEGYKKFNPNFSYDIQSTGSSAGVKSVQEDSAEIGMVSREIKDSEKDLSSSVIAKDGIVVIVNKEATTDDLTLDSVKDIFEGKTTTWK